MNISNLIKQKRANYQKRKEIYKTVYDQEMESQIEKQIKKQAKYDALKNAQKEAKVSGLSFGQRIFRGVSNKIKENKKKNKGIFALNDDDNIFREQSKNKKRFWE